MPRVPRLGLLVSLLAMVAVGTAGAFTAQSASTTRVSATGSDCGCEEGTRTCPTPAPTPVPSTSSVPVSPPPPVPSATAVPMSPPPPLPQPPLPQPSVSAILRLAAVTSEIAAPVLKYVIDVDMTGAKNGEEVRTDPDQPKPPRVKVLCPKRLGVNIAYTSNPFSGQLITIQFIDQGFFPDDCTVTIKVLDPESGRVLETYEQPSDLILTKQDAIGFKHRPARIKVEVMCDE